MGQPPPDLHTTILRWNPEWLGRLLGEFVKTIDTPPPEQAEPREPQPEPQPKDESLKAQAERALGQAIAEGRVTPRLRSPSPAPAPPSELPTVIETPENLEAFREAGRERARARMARMAERTLGQDESRHDSK